MASSIYKIISTLLILVIATAVFQATVSAQSEDGTAVGVISQGRTRVVMGSHLVVGENESLEEVVVIAGSAEIHGQVEKVAVFGGEVTLKPTAYITQEISSVGGVIHTEEGARIEGQDVKIGVPLSEQSWELIFNRLKQTKLGQFLSKDSTHAFIKVFKVIALLMFAICGFYVAPGYQRHVKTYIKKHFVKCIFWGSVSLLLVLPITMLLALSVVGIPLMPLQFSLYFLFFIYGYIHGAQFVVASLIKHIDVLAKWPIMAKILIGLVMLELLGFIPYFGVFLKWLVIFAGFGAASKVFYHQALMPEGRKYA